MKALTKLTLFSAVALAFTACKKDEDPEPTPTTPVTPKIGLEFEFMNGPAQFDINNNLLADSAGRLVSFNKVRFFASHTRLDDMGGNELQNYADKYMLVDAANASNTFELGDSFTGHVHMFHFNVGLDSITNHSNLLDQAPPPLNDATMHWNWNPMAGYKFIVMEGQWDSDGDDLITANDDAFAYHIATDDLLGSKSIMSHMDVFSDSNASLSVHIDMAQVAQGWAISDHPDSHTTFPGDPAEAKALAIRVRDAFLAAMTAH